MKKILFITFDVFKSPENEMLKNYGIASIKAYLKSRPEYKKDFEVKDISFNVTHYEETYNIKMVSEIEKQIKQYDIDWIAVGVYTWSQNIVNKIIPILKNKFNLRVILGGYEITNINEKDKLEKLYPWADYFIVGYGEKAMYDIIINEPNEKVLNKEIDCIELPSPYLAGELKITPNIKRIKMEIKRGCPYNCKFCEWSAISKKISYFSNERIKKEIELFKNYDIEKIYILDPTFNISKKGSNYLEYMEMLAELRAQKILQIRIEAINEKELIHFLNIAKEGNFRLEFGIQTIIEKEMISINRRNNVNKIEKILPLFSKNKIEHECHLIYGLPGQTLQSFMESYNFLKKLECPDIKCFRLRIPTSSELRPEYSYLIERGDAIKEVYFTETMSKNDMEHIHFLCSGSGMDDIINSYRNIGKMINQELKNIKNIEKKIKKFKIISSKNEWFTKKIELIYLKKEYLDLFINKLHIEKNTEEKNINDKIKEELKKINKQIKKEKIKANKFLEFIYFHIDKELPAFLIKEKESYYFVYNPYLGKSKNILIDNRESSLCVQVLSFDEFLLKYSLEKEDFSEKVFPIKSIQKIGIYIDNANLLSRLKETQERIDYKEMIVYIQSYLEKYFKNTPDIEFVKIYDGYINNNKQNFIKSIKNNLKDITEIIDVLLPVIDAKQKGVDTSITRDIIDDVYNKKIDTIVLISGDGDFYPVIQKITPQIPVVIAFFKNKINRNLKKETNLIIDFKNADFISKYKNLK